jgi:hypothetical protein
MARERLNKMALCQKTACREPQGAVSRFFSVRFTITPMADTAVGVFVVSHCTAQIIAARGINFYRLSVCLTLLF